ncbi:MAG TPA: YbaY family lipoprotein, partial [Gemmatimonadaceae bacterium]|nr:YbaY family lipoprotein [Gemmatimonadaceae bacterium]
MPRQIVLAAALALAACTGRQSAGSADTSKAIRAAAAAPRTSVRGEASLDADEPLPAGAIVRIELRDTTRPRDPASVLGTQEFTGDQSPPWAFDLLAPDSLVGAGAALVVSARINAGDRLLFATGEDTPVTVGQANGPLQLRLDPVTQSTGSGAGVGRQQVTPVPTLTVDCGGERFQLAFEAGAAYV